MHNLLVQNKKVVFTALLIATISSYEQKGMILQSVEAGLLGLPFEELSRQAELIILGLC